MFVCLYHSLLFIKYTNSLYTENYLQMRTYPIWDLFQYIFKRPITTIILRIKFLDFLFKISKCFDRNTELEFKKQWHHSSLRHTYNTPETDIGPIFRRTFTRLPTNVQWTSKRSKPQRCIEIFEHDLTPLTYFWIQLPLKHIWWRLPQCT